MIEPAPAVSANGQADSSTTGGRRMHARPPHEATTAGRSDEVRLEGARRGDDVLLVDRGRGELEAVEPDDGLTVVAVRPEGVEDVVGADGDIGVVTEEAAAEPVAGC